MLNGWRSEPTKFAITTHRSTHAGDNYYLLRNMRVFVVYSVEGLASPCLDGQENHSYNFSGHVRFFRPGTSIPLASSLSLSLIPRRPASSGELDAVPVGSHMERLLPPCSPSRCVVAGTFWGKERFKQPAVSQMCGTGVSFLACRQQL